MPAVMRLGRDRPETGAQIDFRRQRRVTSPVRLAVRNVNASARAAMPHLQWRADELRHAGVKPPRNPLPKPCIKYVGSVAHWDSADVLA
jgi:hypothetical protein